MRKIKITVVKVDFNEELCKEYGAPDIVPCPAHQVGQEMYVIDGKKPPELCGGAWGSFEKYVFALAHGLDHFQFPGWLGKDKVCFNTCNDGLRPVTFKLEVVED